MYKNRKDYKVLEFLCKIKIYAKYLYFIIIRKEGNI